MNSERGKLLIETALRECGRDYNKDDHYKFQEMASFVELASKLEIKLEEYGFTLMRINEAKKVTINGSLVEFD
jgi:hypothetical protein